MDRPLSSQGLVAPTNGLGLPAGVRACLFDLDGVLTSTAALHAAAWKATFDQVVSAASDGTGADLRPFDLDTDYLAYVDGRPRFDGVRTFLASRRLIVPEGDESDPPSLDTVHGIGALKNELFQQQVAAGGAVVFEDARHYLEHAVGLGAPVAVVSSSANAVEVLRVTGLDTMVDEVVDGVVARELGLPGKPAPAAFLLGAARLGVTAAEAAVFEDAVVGVAAGRAGEFGAVVGVDRTGQADELREAGADVVVQELTELLGGPTGDDREVSQ